MVGAGGGAFVQGEGSDHPPVAAVSPVLPRGQAQVLSISWVTSQYVTEVMRQEDHAVASGIERIITQIILSSTFEPRCGLGNILRFNL